MQILRKILLSLLLILPLGMRALCNPPDTIDMAPIRAMEKYASKGSHISIYELPYSFTLQDPNWSRLWVNTSVLIGAYVGALVVLECLPEDATTWNRASLQKDPFYERWFNNVFKKGPEWDHDNPVFNYILHPYAGAAYFMAARSCGFNFYQSLLYSSLISTVGWEFGIEACMERPSLQDIFITPLVGSFAGEFFYQFKRHIVENDYKFLGTKVLGYVITFFLDPVNEVIGYFGGNDAHGLYKKKKPQIVSSLTPSMSSEYIGFSFSCTF